MIIGWIGLGLLMIAFALLNTKWSKHFLIVDFIASTLLAIYAIIIKDFVFIVMNSFIAIMVLIKYFKGGLK